MEMELKSGAVIQMELPLEKIEELKRLNKEDFQPVIEFCFLPSGLPGILDLDVYIFFAIANKKYFVDGYSTRIEDDKLEKIKEFMKEALDTASKRGVWKLAVEEFQKELEEE